MRILPLRTLSVVTILLCVFAFPGHSGTGNKQIVIESRFLEVCNPQFDGGASSYPYFRADISGGLKVKIGKKFKANGEKHRGIQMKAKQDDALGFLSLGREFSVTDPLTFSGTFRLPSLKGIKVGSTMGVEFDSPYVPIGGSFDNFLFVGASWETGGLRAYTSLNGTNIGTMPFFGDATSLDILAELDPTGVTIDVRPTGSPIWTNLVTGIEFGLDRSVGIGIGMFGVDKGASLIAGDIRIEGPSIWADPVLTPVLADIDDLREHLSLAHEAMTRRCYEGNPDPDIPGAESHLNQANQFRIKIRDDLAAARAAGELHPDTPFDDVGKKLDKVERKLRPVLEGIPDIGGRFRGKHTNGVRKADLLILVTAKILTVGDEN